MAEKSGNTIDQLLLQKVNFLDGEAPGSPVVISSRIRLARNIKDIPFPAAGDAASAAVTSELIAEALKKSQVLGRKKYSFELAQMNSLDKNIRGARIAVTGYGRIAKHLCALLLSLGAEVTVVARNESDRVWARASGCKTLSLVEGEPMTALAHTYDVIYNTVPHWLFDRSFLEGADPSTFLIDLASVPGGVDICAAKELGANVLWATSLPGKYAPFSAGELIATCVDGILREEVGKE